MISIRNNDNTMFVLFLVVRPAIITKTTWTTWIEWVGVCDEELTLADGTAALT